MFKQYADKAPNIIEQHFSFLSPSLHSVNKVITTKREFLGFLSCLTCSDTPDGWIDVCVCVCDSSAWVGILQQWRLSTLWSNITEEFPWNSAHCEGLCWTLGGNVDTISHTHTLQECFPHREELACREKGHWLLLCSAWTPQQHTHTQSVQFIHSCLMGGGGVSVVFINHPLLQYFL